MSRKHCGTCQNTLCRYYPQREVHMSLTYPRDGTMLSPASFTIEFGCEAWIGPHKIKEPEVMEGVLREIGGRPQ
jgi:hypothetical protein